MRGSFLILILLFLINSIYGQYTVSGIVTDAATSKSISDVEVIIPDTEFGTTTNKDGFFEFHNLGSGEINLLFRHVSYQVHVENIILSENTDLSISMKPKIIKISGITVQEDQENNNLISKAPYLKTKIVKSQITESQSKDVGDLLRTSNNISGIRKGGIGIDPVLRGFKFSQLNVQIDHGIKVEGGCPNRMDPTSAHIESESIENIEIVKGPYALRYGPSFGGVINIITQQPVFQDSLKVRLNASKGYESNWNGHKEHINVSAGDKNFYINLKGGRKQYGNYHDGNNLEVSSSFEKLYYGGQIGFSPNKNHLIYFDIKKSNGKNVRFPSLSMDERMDDTQIMSANYELKTNSDFLQSINFKLYRSDVNHLMDNKYRPFSDTVVAVSTINAINQGLRVEALMNVGTGNLFVGFDHENIFKNGQRTKSMILQPELPHTEEKLWNNAHILNSGVFAEYTREFESIKIIGASRMDFNSAYSDNISIYHPMQGEIYYYDTDSIKSDLINFSLSFGITKKITPQSEISFSLGRGVRSPDMTERYITLLPIGYDKYDYLGNPQLNPEANHQADLTYQYFSEEKGLLQINVFYALITQYIYAKRIPPAIQKPLSKDVLGVKQFYNAGVARLRGFEFVFSTSDQNKLKAGLFASYTYATINKTTKYIINDQGEVVDSEEIHNDALSEIPPFETNLFIHYKLLKGKMIPKISVRYAAPQNHTSEAQYENNSPSFLLVNMSANYQINQYLTFTGGISNIFNTAYYEHLNRTIIGSNLNYFEPGRNIYLNLLIRF